VPIYSTKLTLGMIEGKLAEHKIKNAKFRRGQAGPRIKMGCFSIDFFAVMTTPSRRRWASSSRPLQGNVLHTGDFKLDQTPIDGVTTDYQAPCRSASRASTCS
jgi:ribonuclease J